VIQTWSEKDPVSQGLFVCEHRTHRTFALFAKVLQTPVLEYGSSL
jgi:hypothetical protein